MSTGINGENRKEKKIDHKQHVNFHMTAKKPFEMQSLINMRDCVVLLSV